jgi:hypothetical protein
MAIQGQVDPVRTACKIIPRSSIGTRIYMIEDALRLRVISRYARGHEEWEAHPRHLDCGEAISDQINSHRPRPSRQLYEKWLSHRRKQNPPYHSKIVYYCSALGPRVTAAIVQMPYAHARMSRIAHNMVRLLIGLRRHFPSL